MSDSFVNPIFGGREETATDDVVEGTGNADVDAVVGSLGRLEDLPVADHVGVFERAHESLRRTLAGADSGKDDSAAGRS